MSGRRTHYRVGTWACAGKAIHDQPAVACGGDVRGGKLLATDDPDEVNCRSCLRVIDARLYGEPREVAAAEGGDRG